MCLLPCDMSPSHPTHVKCHMTDDINMPHLHSYLSITVLMKLAPYNISFKVISCPISPLSLTLHATQQQLRSQRCHPNQVCPGHHHKYFEQSYSHAMCFSFRPDLCLWTVKTPRFDIIWSITMGSVFTFNNNSKINCFYHYCKWL